MLRFLFLFIKILALGFTRYEYAGLESTGLTSYSHLVGPSAFAQTTEVDFEDTLYYNESLDIPTISLMRSFTNMDKAKSHLIYGWDKNVGKDVLFTAADFTSQASPAEMTLTLAANDKDHLVLNQMIRLWFTPVGTNYTNQVIVTDKVVGDTTTIKVKPYDYGTNASSLIGVDSTVVVPSGTQMLLLATRVPAGAETFEGIAMGETPITNQFQDIRFPFSVADIAATEKMYIKGTRENLLTIETRAMFNKRREAAYIFNPGSAYIKKVSSGTDTVDDSSFFGLWDAIGNSSSPAKKGYDTFTLDTLDAWCVQLDDSALDDKRKVRFVMCNQALINFITKAKRDKNGIDWAPIDTYGIPGVSRLKWGSITLDIHNHWLFDKLWKDQTKPVAMSLTLPLLKYKYQLKEHIRQNLPTTGTKKLHEFRVDEGFLMHLPDTAYWGKLYPNS